MQFRNAGWILCTAALFGSCGARHTAETASKLTVAAAANLRDVFGEIERTFHARTGVEVIFSYGSTAQLAEQIENGAPFDVFAAADTEHIDSLLTKQKVVADSRAVYALGQLALWIPKGEPSGVRTLKDLTGSQIRYIAVATPELAPYGQATLEALTAAGLLEILRPKFVYAPNINLAKQLATSGNAEAAFTAYSLVLHDQGTILKVEPQLYRPIEQAVAIVASSGRMNEANQFRSFLLGPEGQAILTKSGYLLPPLR